MGAKLSDYSKLLTPAQIGFVYLAGPYRGKDALAHDHTVYCEIDAHINEARRWSAKLAGDGIPYFCPHLNSAHMEVIVPDAPSDYWLEMDLAVLAHARALLLLPDWKESSGARAEKHFAHKAGLRIYTFRLYDRLVRDWWRGLDELVEQKYINEVTD